MKRIKLSGSYYEIGQQLGAILRGEAGYPPRYSTDVLAKAREYKQQLNVHAPGLLEEFQGLADSLGIDPAIPIIFEASPYRFQMSSCFVMAIAGKHTANGRPVLARNHEWMERDSENLRLCYTQPKGKLLSLGFTFSWPLVSRYGGVNEAGVALSSSSASFEVAGAGIMLNLATRWVLDTCRTTEDAVAYLQAMPKVWGETYVIVDAANTIAKVEAHRNLTTVTYAEDGFAFNSLLYDSPAMKSYLGKERIASCEEYVTARKEFLTRWFAQNRGAITNDLIEDALRSHEHKMCYHGLEGLEICWSYILPIGAATALVCAGRPCKNPFVDIDMP